MLFAGHPDNAFFSAQGEPIAGVMRGARDGPLDAPRSKRTIQSKNNPKGGGINGGFVVFKPSRRDYKKMLQLLGSRGTLAWGPDNEQGLISEYFAGYTEQLPRTYNFQVHQLTLAAPLTRPDMEWQRLVRNIEDVKVFHFSAIPKPINFLLGTLSTESVGHMAESFPGLSEDLQHCPWRSERGVQAIADHHDARRRAFSDTDLDKIWVKMYHELYRLYAHTFNNNIWPSIIQHIIDGILKIAVWTANDDTEDDSCYACGACGRKSVGWRHFLFDCPLCMHMVAKRVFEIAPTEIVENFASPDHLHQHVIDKMAGCPGKPSSCVLLRFHWFAALIYVWEKGVWMAGEHVGEGHRTGCLHL